MTHQTLQVVATELGYRDVSALYAAVGENNVSAQHVVSKLVESLGGEDGAEETLAEGVSPGQKSGATGAGPEAAVNVEGLSSNEVWVKLARCCTPVPGDEIAGFITRGQGVSVHRMDCLNATRLRGEHPERFVDVSWASDQSTGQYLVEIEIKALNRPGLLSDLSKVLSEHHVDIVSGSMMTTGDQLASARFTFGLPGVTYLDTVLASLRGVDGVFEASRRMGNRGGIERG